jgi:LacI family transcriptional regulator
MVTVKDVARRAGVSQGTVSNVLNHPRIVASSTKARVRAAIAELGYTPNARARQLRTGDSRIIGLLIPDMGNPFFVALANGVEHSARKVGLRAMVCTSAQSAAEEAEYLDFFVSLGVLGVLVAPVDANGPAFARLRRQEIPFVLLDRTPESTEACSVTVDNVAGGRLAVQHLISAGHRSIAYIAGPDAIPQVRDRRSGALTALSGAGLPPTILKDIRTDQMDISAGRRAGKRLLELADRPTAVFCANDLLALGAQAAFAADSAHRDGDVAIVGYDDTGFAAAAATLSSVRQPTSRLAAHAVDMLIEEATSGTPHHHRNVVLQPELVVRGSASTG